MFDHVNPRAFGETSLAYYVSQHYAPEFRANYD